MNLRKAIPFALIFIAGIAIGVLFREIPKLNKLVASSDYPYCDFHDSLEQLNQEFPKCSSLVSHLGHVIAYDYRTRNALWVYERLTAEGLRGDANRSKCRFKEDPTIPLIFRSQLEDYHTSGFDRGHLAPAANHKGSQEEMEDTFYLSNISPQIPQFNRGYWAKLEKHVRDLTKSFDVVEVFTGPVYLAQEEEDGSKWVKYQVIGKNEVAVPTHFYKVLFLESHGEKTVVAYMLPNKKIEPNTPLDRFETTLMKVERVSGVLFTKPING